MKLAWNGLPTELPGFLSFASLKPVSTSNHEYKHVSPNFSSHGIVVTFMPSIGVLVTVLGQTVRGHDTR